MSLFSRFFKKKDHPPSATGQEAEQKESQQQEQASKSLPWIAPADNPWHVPLLDLRPVTETMVSTSQNQQMAANAISYAAEDGLVFVNEIPENPQEIRADLRFPVDVQLYPGVLFIPNVMEHKWAIYFHADKLIFVRSWLRQVFVTAKTRQENGLLIVESVQGKFGNEAPAHTLAILHFLMTGYVRNQIVPAPLPEAMQEDTDKASMWSFSLFGKVAKIGVFDEQFKAPAEVPVRSHSLLHIAVARGDLAAITHFHQQGWNLNALAADGLTALQWSMAPDDTHILEHLLSLGADVDARSAEGATTLMNAAQSNRPDALEILIKAGANVNEKDDRGFTALHWAAELGHLEIAKVLLAHGADKHANAQGHTPVSLAQMGKVDAMIALLK